MLDLEKIELLRDVGASKRIGRCPACAEESADAKLEHFFIYADGKWGCVVYPGDEGNEHRKRIMALVGIPSKGKPWRPFIPRPVKIRRP